MSLKNISSQRQVLGRGLDSLFSPSNEQKSKNTSPSTITTLGIEQIEPNPQQPRQVFDKEFLKSLATSIEKNGLIQPIIVKKNGLKYEIIAGERRWRAAGQAGLHEVPVRILEKDNPFLSLIENLQRENLNPIELAKAYQKLIKTQKFTQEQLADQLGIPRTTLANQLRLLKLTSEVQQLILKGQLSFTLAKILLQEKNSSNQIKWAHFFIQNNTGVREAQKLLSQKHLKKTYHTVKQEIKSWQKQAINKIQSFHGVKSTLRFKKKGGELCLRFFSEEELHYLIEVLLKTNSQIHKK